MYIIIIFIAIICLFLASIFPIETTAQTTADQTNTSCLPTSAIDQQSASLRQADKVPEQAQSFLPFTRHSIPTEFIPVSNCTSFKKIIIKGEGNCFPR